MNSLILASGLVMLDLVRPTAEISWKLQEAGIALNWVGHKKIQKWGRRTRKTNQDIEAETIWLEPFLWLFETVPFSRVFTTTYTGRNIHCGVLFIIPIITWPLGMMTQLTLVTTAVRRDPMVSGVTYRSTV